MSELQRVQLEGEPSQEEQNWSSQGTQLLVAASKWKKPLQAVHVSATSQSVHPSLEGGRGGSSGAALPGWMRCQPNWAKVHSQAGRTAHTGNRAVQAGKWPDTHPRHSTHFFLAASQPCPYVRQPTQSVGDVQRSQPLGHLMLQRPSASGAHPETHLVHMLPILPVHASHFSLSLLHGTQVPSSKRPVPRSHS